MATGKRFKNNASEEVVSIGKGSGTVIATGATVTIPENAPYTREPEIIEINGLKLPEPMQRPEPTGEYTPIMAEPKIVLEKMKDEDTATMNAGCEKLLEYLPPDAADLIREYRGNNEIPLWHVIAGYVMRCREQSELFAPLIMPDWTDAIAPNSLRPCGTCGDAMKALVAGQQFCCNRCFHGKPDHNEDCSVVRAAA